MAQFKVGDFVQFGRPNGEQTVGRVIRVNAASLTIEQLEERGSTRIRQAGTKWRVAPSLVHMAGVATPAPAPVKMSEAEIILRLQVIEAGMSSENLYCDGERSAAEARRIAARLNEERKGLVKMLGREPTSRRAV